MHDPAGSPRGRNAFAAHPVESRPDQPAARWRARLAHARLMCLWTPARLAGQDPLAPLAAALPWCDLVQVRVEPLTAGGPAPARATLEAARAVLELVEGLEDPPPVLVNDRADVAWILEGRCAGVHLGQEDLPAAHARRLLGEAPLVGRSSHDARQVAAACEQPVDYLGFGPVFATATKGYDRGLGPHAAWVAAQASPFPVFAIGGITPENAAELRPVGRVAVSSAVLESPDPAGAARAIREALTS